MADLGTWRPVPYRTFGHSVIWPQGSNDLAPRRKRASKPKVRTGCKTCKIRRIKCDETKPSCKRCTSTGRRCDGYEFPREPPSDPPPPSSTFSPPHKSMVTFTGLFLPGSMSTPFQGTAQEKRIFHRFQVRTVPVFVGGSETGFWNSLVLKVGQQEPVVRNAIIALGSLHEDYQIRGGKFDNQLIDDPSHRAITLLYGKAVRQLHEQLNDRTKATAKIAIISSILFTCFEVLRRNNMAAVVHYQAGMRELIRQMNLPGDDSTSLTPYAQRTTPQKANFSEIPKNELDDLLRVFARYDIQACTFSKDIAEPLNANVPRVLPTSFTLAEVRTHLDNLLVSIYQLIKSDFRMYRYWNVSRVPMDWQLRRDEAVEVFEAWMNALDRFLETTPIPMLNATEQKNVLGLRLQIRIAIMMLKVCIDCGPERTFDTFQHEFEDMIAQVEHLTTSLALVETRPLDRENTAFSMDLGVVHPLFFMALKCRDGQLRRRAITQLKKVGKEGVWEGPIMAVLAHRLMELEEQGLSAGDAVPERNRWHDVKKNVDYEGRKIMFEATRALDDTWENWFIHRDSISF